MKYWSIIKQSFKAIFANKVRSFLTVLGIVIGIGSVIALVSLVAGVKSSVSGQINKLGSTNVIISSGKSRFTSSQGSGQSQGSFVQQREQNAATSASVQTATLTQADFNSLSNLSAHPDYKTVSGTISGTSTISTASGEQSFQTSGSPAAVFTIQDLNVNTGKLFTNADVTNTARVAVLGSQVAKDAFGSEKAIGKTVKIGSQDYLIIGVLNDKTSSSFTDPNSYIYVPYTSLSVDSGVTNFSRITVDAKSESQVDAVKTDVQNILLKNHGQTDIAKADFSVMTSKDLLSTVSNITGIMSALLGGIAGISLLVGGIGIMNIMLVSVTERTREIGLRKAVGAKTSDILTQFLTEAVILTLIGGVFGILLGYLGGIIIAKFVNVSPVIDASSVALAVGVSSAIGLIFGIYPAAKAARLNPIDALRYE